MNIYVFMYLISPPHPPKGSNDIMPPYAGKTEAQRV